jgi:hypothetical protein
MPYSHGRAFGLSGRYAPRRAKAATKSPQQDRQRAGRRPGAEGSGTTRCDSDGRSPRTSPAPCANRRSAHSQAGRTTTPPPQRAAPTCVCPKAEKTSRTRWRARASRSAKVTDMRTGVRFSSPSSCVARYEPVPPRCYHASSIREEHSGTNASVRSGRPVTEWPCIRHRSHYGTASYPRPDCSGASLVRCSRAGSVFRPHIFVTIAPPTLKVVRNFGTTRAAVFGWRSA